MHVYDRVPRDHQKQNGGTVIGVRWVDVNKGDSATPDYRSRSVGQLFATHRDDSLYASTPPLEALRMVLSYAATIGVGEDKKQILIADVTRAYFYAMARRNLYIELPQEDELGGPGMLGKLRLNFYGTRDGASNWQEHLSAHMIQIGFKRGVGHPSVFWHEARKRMRLVHGDDYVSAGDASELVWLEGELHKAYGLKVQKLGPGAAAEGKVLNRIL